VLSKELREGGGSDGAELGACEGDTLATLGPPRVCCVGAEALGGGRTQMVAYQSNVDTVKTIQEREDAMARREKELQEEM
jgi:hypothetical protein